MKRCCKNVDILSDGFIENATFSALAEKWNRNDVAKYLSDFTSQWSKKQIHKLLSVPSQRRWMSGVISTSAEVIRQEIRERDLKVEPIRYSLRKDGHAGKLREIGVECVKQLILDEVANIACEELWRKKIGYHQYAALAGKGQINGKKAIENQIRKHYMQSRWCWKGDVRHCYNTVNIRTLKRMLSRDIKNETLLYLLFFLIDTYKEGLNIGSGLSQYLCNYYLARAYRYVLSLRKVRKHKNGTVESRRLVYLTLFYMDDIILVGAREADVRRAAALLAKFLKKELGQEIKADAVLFKIDYFRKDVKKEFTSYKEKDKVIRRGRPIDMMGFVVYRDHTEIREGTFLRARRAYMRVWRKLSSGKTISLKTAQRCCSYFGYFKNTDSLHFREKYHIDSLKKYCGKVVSYYAKSEVYGAAA